MCGLVGGGGVGKGYPGQFWLKHLRDDFQALGDTLESTEDDMSSWRRLFTVAALVEGGAPWYAEVLQGTERSNGFLPQEGRQGQLRGANNIGQQEKHNDQTTSERGEGRHTREQVSVERPVLCEHD